MWLRVAVPLVSVLGQRGRNGQLLLRNRTAKLYSQHDGIGPAWPLAADQA